MNSAAPLQNQAPKSQPRSQPLTGATRANPLLQGKWADGPPSPALPPFNFARVPIAAPTIQRKPTVSSPGEPLEPEADEIADGVMRKVETGTIGGAQAGIQRKCAVCEQEEKKAPPEGSSGKCLLAHELTHVVQQGQAAQKRGGAAAPIATATVWSSRLRLGDAGDSREMEADRVADAAIRVRSASRRVTPVARQPGRRGHELAVPAIVDRVIAGPGRSLDAESRVWLEPRLGRGFEHVRIHTGALAEQSASAIGARAYTVGHDIVFGANQYDPATAGGRRLLAHEVTHVLQQGDGSDLVQRDLIFGSGYPNPFAGKPADETAAARANPREWFPSSVDFEQTARLSGGGTGLATLAGVLAQIRGKSPRSVTDIDLVGHANADLFSLGGTITRDSVSGTGAGTIGARQLAALQTDIDAVRDRFAPGAHITIYGCNSGASGTLLQAISMAFKVCARGFTDPITWCLGWQLKPLAINSRGRTLINPPDNKPCDDYNGSVYNLTPDTEDCSGTRPKAPDVTLRKREPTVPQVPE
jgi:hypothetical protein